MHVRIIGEAEKSVDISTAEIKVTTIERTGEVCYRLHSDAVMLDFTAQELRHLVQEIRRHLPEPAA